MDSTALIDHMPMGLGSAFEMHREKQYEKQRKEETNNK